MSFDYDQYLIEHRSGVANAFYWLKNHDLIDDEYYYCCQNCIVTHDASKDEAPEYEAYDAYFYGGNRSYQVCQDFEKAFLFHLHRNPHHWQYWILINDGGEDHEEVIFEMPYQYAVEMICDWWSFSFKNGDLYEIFDWYEKRKTQIRLHKNTRKFVEDMLGKIKTILDEENHK